MPEFRKKFLTKQWKQIAKSSIVITDRLHGMIFSYLTQTPCIVLANNNGKIKSAYTDWLCDCNFIKFVNNEDNILNYINDLRSIKIDKKDFNKGFFDSLSKCIKNNLKSENEFHE